MADELEKHLESHGRAFEGLMSLIPAKLYYEQDNSDQWRRKKQTKEEKQAARKAKLDPRNIKSAKDIMDENERKRKREAGEEEDGAGEGENTAAESLSDREGREKPLEGLKSKRQKNASSLSKESQQQQSEKQIDEGKEDAAARKAEKRRVKRARQHEKRVSDKEKELERQKQTKEKPQPSTKVARETSEGKSRGHHAGSDPKSGSLEDEDADESDEDEEKDDITLRPAAASSSEPLISNRALSGKKPRHQDDPDSRISEPRLSPSDISSNPDSTFSPALEQHAATSESSLDDTTIPTDTKPPLSKLSPIDTKINNQPANTSAPEQKEPKETLRARLEAKIAALRAARKADGEDGKPIRTRQELIEHRRRKELERKQRKKKQREAAAAAAAGAGAETADGAGQAPDLEQRARAEAELARLRGDTGSPIAMATSPSITSTSDYFSNPSSTRPPPSKLSFDPSGLAYSRLAFSDSQTSSTTTKKRPGPTDPKSQLAKAEARAQRLAALDPAARADIAAKEAWTRARQRIAGEKPMPGSDIVDPDSTTTGGKNSSISLLKRALKRKEKQKAKSSREWAARSEGVAKAQEARQRKREENLQKRRDEKNSRGGGGKGKGGGKSKSKSKGGGGKKEKSDERRARKRAFG